MSIALSQNIINSSYYVLDNNINEYEFMYDIYNLILGYESSNQNKLTKLKLNKLINKYNLISDKITDIYNYYDYISDKIYMNIMICGDSYFFDVKLKLNDKTFINCYEFNIYYLKENRK